MRLQAKDIVLSNSLDITPLHSYQAKRLLTGPLQNKVFETQQTNSGDYVHPLNDLRLAYSASSSPSTSLIMMPVSLESRDTGIMISEVDWPLLRIFNT